MQRAWREFSSSDKATEWADTNFEDWRDSLPSEQEEALKDYQGVTHREINGALRQDRVSGLMADYVEEIGNAIEQGVIPEDIVTYRGFHNNQIIQNWDRIVGTRMRDKAFVSVSLSKKVGASFATAGEDVLATIRIPKGTKAAWVNALKDIGEAELLLQRDASFKIIRAFINPDGIRELILELAA